MTKKRRTQQTAQSEPEADRSSTFRFDLITAVLIAILCFVAYATVFGHDFINFDDDIYVYENARVSSGLTARSIAWAFTTFHATNWHPITWLSHQLDVSLFGMNAAGHHLINVVIHAANSVLVFFFLRALTGDLWKCAIAAGIFAVHPAHVESVAWIAERKDVLSTLFWLLASISYVRYTKDIADKRAYWASVILFAVGLMAKPMLVTFPFVLLLLDLWPLKRIAELNWTSLRPVLFEKIPFFALAAVSAVITVLAQGSGGAIQTLERFPLQDRLLNALVSYSKYLLMMVYPVDLGVWYPFDANFSTIQIAAAAIVFIGTSAVALWQIRSRPYLFVGWFWFVGTLVPVIGLVQVGRQALADRYTYVPYIGLSIAVIWLAADLAKRVNIPVIVPRVAGVIAVFTLTIVTFGQVKFWKNSETLYTRTLAVTKNNYLAEANYCQHLEQLNRLDEAVKHCGNAIEADPRGLDALNTLGTVQMKQGKLDDARRNFNSVIEINPDFALAYANLAIVETKQQNPRDALEYFQQGVARDAAGSFDSRRRAEGFSAIGASALVQKQYDVAIRAYEQALEAAPDNPDLQRNLANAYRAQGRVPDAIRLLESVIQKNPNSPEAYNSLGIVYAEQGRKQDAITQFQRALQISPNFSQAQSNLRKAME